MWKKLLPGLVVLYVAGAGLALAAEAAGVTTCPCTDDCWCKRPGLNVFRWVFPRGHQVAYATR